MTTYSLKQLCTWFRWRANGSRRSRLQKKQTSVFDQIIAPKGSRVLSKPELYAVEYYEDRIKPQVKDAQEAGRLGRSRGDTLTFTRKLSRELLDAKDEEVKQKINAIYDAQPQKKGVTNAQVDDPTDPVAIQA